MDALVSLDDQFSQGQAQITSGSYQKFFCAQ